jgi:hypothetical protein
VCLAQVEETAPTKTLRAPCKDHPEGLEVSLDACNQFG